MIKIISLEKTSNKIKCYHCCALLRFELVDIQFSKGVWGFANISDELESLVNQFYIDCPSCDTRLDVSRQISDETKLYVNKDYDGSRD